MITFIVLLLLFVTIFQGSTGILDIILKVISGFFHMLFVIIVLIFSFKILFKGLSSITNGDTKVGIFSVISGVILILEDMIFLSKKINATSLGFLVLFVVVHYIGRIYLENN